MTTKPHRNLSAEVNMLASALLQSAPHAAQPGPVRIVAMPGETQAEAQRHVAAMRAKLR